MKLIVSGTVYGSGIYTTVPASFGPVTGTLTLTKIIDGAEQPLISTFLTLTNVSASWANNTLTVKSPTFNLIETVNIPPGIATDLYTIGIPETGKPAFLIGGTLLTTITTGSGVFNILTNSN